MKHDCNHHAVHRPQAIAAWIGRDRASGLALKGFAREERPPPGRRHYWRYQKRRPSAPSGSGTVPGPLFQEVKVAAGARLVAGWAAEVSLLGGRAVRFSAAAALAWVGAVVQALERPC